ncbi:MAG: Holliday junction branch migration protein RuvA [Bacteroidetes bacterium]|nr:Holliday junction branch migration protein RuvA [Rhodothermia bacterium]MCS7154738.1 Holliday junction branch migration protein RuvA [Bacteroidota bacterium]MCX7907105.1 Holliday junction branch migration protein RuvA [Bacteroidota bacterium]MDW8137531.1 Holliday junction branch migration protein RuvA [Bacteroidota bacterium]MDW8285515.1 Holliday junction branch migration protein RuvA [Bacteroidota bacterium]
MIARLRGRLLEKTPPRIVLEVGGIGFELWTPTSTCALLPDPEAEVVLYTYLYVRSEAVALYGFATPLERALFEQLLAVSGVGPRSALALLSSLSAQELREAILARDAEALRRAPGIGRKTAERLILELADRLPLCLALDGRPDPPIERYREAVLALMALGCSRASAERAVRAVLRAHPEGEPSLEELIRLALKEVT